MCVCWMDKLMKTKRMVVTLWSALNVVRTWSSFILPILCMVLTLLLLLFFFRISHDSGYKIVLQTERIYGNSFSVSLNTKSNWTVQWAYLRYRHRCNEGRCVWMCVCVSQQASCDAATKNKTDTRIRPHSLWSEYERIWQKPKWIMLRIPLAVARQAIDARLK